MALKTIVGHAINIILGFMVAVSSQQDGVLVGEFTKVLLARDSSNPTNPKLKAEQFVEVGVAPLPWSSKDSGLTLNHLLDLKIGTPPRTIRMIVDTGSSVSCVQALDYTNCQSTALNCPEYTNYTVSQSSSARRVGNDSFNMGYGQGTAYVDADVFAETVVLGNRTLRDFPVGIARRNDFGISLLGLGPPAGGARVTGKNFTRVPTFLQTLRYQGVIASTAFSLYPNGKDKGSIIFGGIDSSKYESPLQIVTMKNRTRRNQIAYMIDFDSLTLSDGNSSSEFHVDPAFSEVALDSGATLTYLPRPLLAQLDTALGVRYGDSSTTAMIDCKYRNSNKTLTFNVGSGAKKAAIKVPLKSLVYNEGSGCALSIGGAEAVWPFIQLSDNVLSQIYTVFDHDHLQIGFAPLKADSAAAAPNIRPILPGQGIPGNVFD